MKLLHLNKNEEGEKKLEDCSQCIFISLSCLLLSLISEDSLTTMSLTIIILEISVFFSQIIFPSVAQLKIIIIAFSYTQGHFVNVNHLNG